LFGYQHAFLYSNGSLQYLNTLIPSNSGWTLAGASGIDDSGKIVGCGTNGAGQTDAFLLTPTPEPSTLVLLAIAAASLFAYAWQRRRQAA
jgi:probable HAF family extracellular repeat protein